MIHKSEFFTKGIDNRTSTERAEGSFAKLSNVRLSKRGSTGFVTRLPGTKPVTNERLFYNPIGFVAFRQFVVGVDKINIGLFSVVVFNTMTNRVVFEERYNAQETDFAELVVVGDTIYFAPHDLQLNYIDNSFKLNSFTSTVPTFEVSNYNVGVKSSVKFVFLSGNTSGDDTDSWSFTNQLPGGFGLWAANYGGVVIPLGQTFTAEQIRDLLYERLLGDPIPGSLKLADYYFFEKSTAVYQGVEYPAIKATALRAEQVNLYSADPGDFNVLNGTVFDGGGYERVVYTDPDVTDNGNLTPNTPLTYKVRYVWYDGHATRTSYAKHIHVETNGAVFLKIDAVRDLDGGWADIEIFRSEKGQGFNFLARVTPTSNIYVYKDDGRTPSRALDDESYIWPSEPQTHTMVRDRYVRAGVNFDSVIQGYESPIEINLFDVAYGLTSEDNLPLIPFSSEAKFYTKVRFVDGTESFHKLAASVISNEVVYSLPILRTLEVKITGEFAEIDGRAVKEIALYAAYNKLPNTSAFAFDVLEFANKNVPTIISTAKYDSLHPYYDQPDDYPANPHVFLGWRYATLVYNSNTPSNSRIRMYDGEFDRNVGVDFDTTDSNDDYIDFGAISNIGDFIPGSPAKYLYYTRNSAGNSNSVYTWQFGTPTNPLTGYRLKYSSPPTAGLQYFIYEMEALQALKRAIPAGSIRARMSSSLLVVSNSVDNADYTRTWVKVVGIKDTAEGYVLRENGHAFPPGRNHVYLILERDTIYDNIDNRALNNPANNASGYELVYPTDGVPVQIKPQAVFELGYFYAYHDPTATSQVTGSYTTWNVPFKLYSTGDAVDLKDTLIYIGSFANTPFQSYTWKRMRTGYEYSDIDGWVSAFLPPDNIYETYLNPDSIQSIKKRFDNQLWWSDSFILGSNASRIRNFQPVSFKNIPDEYGKIVRIVPSNNNLLVFTERAVYAVTVGEVLTQQTDSGLRVDSSRLLNTDFPVLRNLVAVQAESVVTADNRVFFSDGVDVWMLTEGWANITAGKINLSYGKHRAFYDQQQREYHIYDGTNTYTYNIEIEVWTGPHTFGFVNGSNVFGQTFILASDARTFLKFDNATNTFNGREYTSVVESNLIGAGDYQITKIWRKFYVDHVNAEQFGYKNVQETEYTLTDINKLPRYAGLTHIGISELSSNAISVGYKVVSKLKNFVLKLVDIEFTPRTRR